MILTLKKEFLQKAEWSSADLSPTIRLYATDGREFNNPFTFNIKVNTPPPAFTHYTVAKTKDVPSSPAYYVLCLPIPDMDKTVAGGLLHKDLARIEINGASYPFSVNEAQTGLVKPESDGFITPGDVEKLGTPDADELPAENWTLYYKTDVEVKDGAVKKEYTVRLADAKGLVSGILNASTKPNKPKAEVLTITKGTHVSGSGSETDPNILGVDSTGAELTVASETANTTVHCTVRETGSAVPLPYQGNPVTLALPLNGANEKTYKVEYYTDGEGFAATAVKTVYYKTVKGHTVTFDANSGTYANASTTVVTNALHGTLLTAPNSLPVKTGYTLTGWYKDSTGSPEQAWNFEADTVNGNITLYAGWTAAGNTVYKVEHYQQKIDGTYPMVPTEPEDKTGTTGENITGVAKTYQGFDFDKQEPASATIAADGSTVVKVYYKRKQITVTFKLNGGSIGSITNDVSQTGRYGAPLNQSYTITKTGYSFTGWSPEVPPAFPEANTDYTAQWHAHTYTVVFNGGSGATGSMSPQSFRYDELKELTGNGFTRTGYIFQGWAKSADSSTAEYQNQEQVSNLTDVDHDTVTLYAVWKPEEYLVSFNIEPATDGQNGDTGYIRLSGGSGTPMSTSPAKIKHGELVTFTVDPAEGWEVKNWTGAMENSSNSKQATLTVTSPVTVTVTLKLKPVKSWKELKNAVKIAPSGSTILVDGTITATNATENFGEIVINKNLTIKPKSETATLNADCVNTGQKHRIFNVQTGGELTLNNITVKGGKVSDGAGGAIKASGSAKITLTDCVITDNSVENYDGGAIAFDNSATGALTLTETVIENNTVYATDAVLQHGGGGISIENVPVILTISGKNAKPSKITGNKINYTGSSATLKEPQGCGLWLGNRAITKIKGTVEITNNTSIGSTAGQGGGIWLSGGSVTLKEDNGQEPVIKDNSTENGGGIYIADGKFDMRSGTITGNTAQNGGGVYMSDGIFEMKGGARITPSTDTDKNVPGKNDVYLKTGKKITVTGSLTQNPAARITPEIYPTDSTQVQVLSGSAVSTEYAKFTVTSDSPANSWTIDDAGNLKLATAEITGGDTLAWKNLKEAVAVMKKGGTITVSGTIKASSAQGNSGAITINKDLTIKVKNGTATLDANNLGGIFVVEENAKFTFEKLNLKNASGASAIVVKSGTTTMNSGSITDCHNDSSTGGGCSVYQGAEFIMNDGSITNCSANSGGGVYLLNAWNGGTFTMNGGSISNCTATSGAGVFMNILSVFNIKGTASVNSNSPVHFEIDNSYPPKIVVQGDCSSNPVMKIKPSRYEEGKQILHGEKAFIQGNHNKFTVEPDGSNTYMIDDNGMLKKN